MQALPEKAGIDLANWNWKVVRRFVRERFGLSLSRSSCLNYLHRLGFVLKRTKKHFLKADGAKREAFLSAYRALLIEAREVGAKRPASYYSAVCLETGEVEVMELEGYSNAETSTAFMKQLRDKHAGPLNVIWDNAPAHHGDALRAYLATPDLRLRLGEPAGI